LAADDDQDSMSRYILRTLELFETAISQLVNFSLSRHLFNAVKACSYCLLV